MSNSRSLHGALEPVVATAELSQRPSRRPDAAAENRALNALARELATSPESLLQKLAETAMGLCRAHSAGISLLKEDRKSFEWVGVVGLWAPHLNGNSDPGLGPFGVVLERDVALLFSHPERHFPYLASGTPGIDEALLIPFHVDGQPIGTIWVIAHDQSVRFDAEDLRVITSLGVFASAAYQMLLSLKTKIKAESELRRTSLVSANLAAIVQSSSDAIIGKNLQAIITSWNRGAEQLYGYTAEEVIGHPVSILLPPGRDDELAGIMDRILQGKTVQHYETKRRRKDGTIIDVSISISPVTRDGELVGASAVARDITERKQIEKMKRAESTRRLILENVLRAQEDERRRLARELHDEAGQLLTSILVGLCTVQECGSLADVQTHAARLRAVAALAIEDIGRLARGLHPTLLDDHGLEVALSHYVSQYRKAHNISVDLSMDQVDLTDLLPGVQLTLYRVLQECLTNVAKHSGATEVKIDFARSAIALKVNVTDNGCGFDVKAVASASPTRLGIESMRERVAMLGGTFEIASDCNQTQVMIQIPLSRRVLRGPEELPDARANNQDQNHDRG